MGPSAARTVAASLGSLKMAATKLCVITVASRRHVPSGSARSSLASMWPGSHAAMLPRSNSSWPSYSALPGWHVHRQLGVLARGQA